MKKLISLASFNLSFHWFSIGVILPVQTLFLQEKGLSLTQIGLSFAAYSIATIFLELPSGAMADQIGRKRVYLFSLFLQGGAALSLVLLQHWSTIVIAFAVQGSARALSSGTMDSLFIDEMLALDSQVDLQSVMSKLSFFIPLSLGISSLIGGVIPSIPALSRWGYGANFLAYFACILLQFILTHMLVREHRNISMKSSLVDGFATLPRQLRSGFSISLKQPALGLLLIAGAVWGLGIGALEQLWQPRLADIAGPPSWVFGVLTAGYFAASSLGSLASPVFTRMLGTSQINVLIFSRLLLAAMLFALAQVAGIQLFAFCYILLFLFNGTAEPAEQALFHRLIPAEQRSTLVSLSSLGVQAGGLLASLALIPLAESRSIAFAWSIAAGVLGLSALCYVCLPSQLRRQSKLETMHEL